MRKNLIIAAVSGLAGVSLLTGSGLVFAQTVQNDGNTFLQKLASRLNITEDKLTEAAKDTQYEIIDEKVANGQMDETKANDLKERIASNEGLMGWDRGMMGEHGKGGPGRNPEMLAGFLGITTAEVEQLQSQNFTIDQILTKYNKTQEDLQNYMETNMPVRDKDIDMLAIYVNVSRDEISELVENKMTRKEILERYGKSLEDFKTYMEENRPEHGGWHKM